MEEARFETQNDNKEQLRLSWQKKIKTLRGNLTIKRTQLDVVIAIKVVIGNQIVHQENQNRMITYSIAKRGEAFLSEAMISRRFLGSRCNRSHDIWK